MSVREALDNEGRLTFGKYRGRLAEDIAREEPGYLRWVVEEFEDLDEGDRQVLESLLAFRGRL